MPRYVVVEFADNGQAESFVQQLNRDNELDRAERRPFTTRVVGMFVKPGRTCECSDRGRANYGDKNHRFATIRLGPKFGWWVCSRCNRPRAAGHQLVNQLKLSDTYEGKTFNDFEFEVTGVQITGIHKLQFTRPKGLRRKKVKHGG